jgi:hypothetical protein
VTKLELAKEYVAELYNAAEHVARGGAEEARVSLENGRPGAALEELENVRRSAEFLDMRYRDAVRAVREAAEDPANAICAGCDYPISRCLCAKAAS